MNSKMKGALALCERRAEPSVAQHQARDERDETGDKFARHSRYALRKRRANAQHNTSLQPCDVDLQQHGSLRTSDGDDENSDYDFDKTQDLQTTTTTTTTRTTAADAARTAALAALGKCQDFLNSVFVFISNLTPDYIFSLFLYIVLSFCFVYFMLNLFRLFCGN